MAEDRMLSDEILLGLIKANSGGGTSNYNDLSNKPQIGGVTLSGNKSASDLGLVAAVDGKGLSTNDYTDADKAIVGGVTAALAGKQGALTAGNNIKIDNDTISVNRWAVPAGKVVYTVITSDENYGQNVHVQRHTIGGTFIDDRIYYVPTWQTATVDDVISIADTYGKFEITLLKNSDEQSAGYKYIVQPTTTPTSNSFTFMGEQEENDNDLIIRSELDAKQDTLTFDDVPTANSNNPVKSGGVKSAIDAAVSSAYHHAGTKTCAELVAGLLVAGNEGNVYNMTDSGTTTADFIEGAGQPIKAGDNVGIAKISDGVYKFDLLSGFVDTTNFVQKSVTAGLLKNDGTVDTTIQGDVATLKSGLTNVSGEVDTIKNGIVYGFHIDGSVSDPSNRVTYLRDAIGKTPAYMNYNEGSFNYGSWEDAFFMPRPCMVERSGNVAYYLDPNDYTKKTDGTASDIADTTYAGNAMMEWGRDGKKIWMKIEPDSGDANSCNVYIADHRVDATYHDWSFHNCNGVSVDHFYTPIYNGSAVSDGTNNVLRSLSGQYISHSQNASTEITMAGRNNAGSAEIWGTEVYADIVLINMLLTLIGKSTNTQAVFGRGLDSGFETAMKAYVTGTLNDKGLFFGYNDGDHGVKVFGMENWWACQWRRYRGHIMVDGTQKVKLTYGTEDGSTAAGYNLTGDNYISVGATPTGTSGQYCDKYEFSPNGAFPKDADNTKATASTHYCDGLWFNNSGTRVPSRGGASIVGSLDGAWSVDLGADASNAWWGIGAALSCKPLA